MSRGFTFIELLIALVIVGILSAIALPTYSAVLTRAQRNEARLALLKVQHAQERHYQLHLRYSDRFDLSLQQGGLAMPGHSDAGNYLLSVRLQDEDQRYVAVARPDPRRRQAGDRECAEITLDDTGRRGAITAAGTDSREHCW